MRPLSHVLPLSQLHLQIKAATQLRFEGDENTFILDKDSSWGRELTWKEEKEEDRTHVYLTGINNNQHN